MAPSATPAKGPVVLVPGAFGQDYVYWNLIKHQLRKRGYAVHTVSFPTLTLSDLRVSAHVLADRLLEIREESAHEGPFTLVAHSMGGLISRYFLQFLKGAPHTRRLVCMATPHHGTYTGIAGYPLTGARQILPGSDFLRELNRPDALDHGVPITNIWSRTDFIVVPRGNALLDAPNVTNVQHTWEGHWGILVSPGIVRRIVEVVEADHGVPPPSPQARPLKPQRVDAFDDAPA